MVSPSLVAPVPPVIVIFTVGLKVKEMPWADSKVSAEVLEKLKIDTRVRQTTATKPKKDIIKRRYPSLVFNCFFMFFRIAFLSHYHYLKHSQFCKHLCIKKGPQVTTSLWLRGLDLNQRPFGYEPNELPDCSTPRHNTYYIAS